MLAYYHGHQTKQHIAQWGIPGFRILALIKSEERKALMLKVLSEITGDKKWLPAVSSG